MKNKIYILVSGGLVFDIRGLPKDCGAVVVDYDNSENVSSDEARRFEKKIRDITAKLESNHFDLMEPLEQEQID
jgi:hypothetical protein